MTAFAVAPLSAHRLTIPPGSTTFFGVGEIARLPACVDLVGKRRVFVVTDPGVVASGVAGLTAGVLAGAALEHAVYDGLRPNPDTVTLEAGARAPREVREAP